MIFQERNIMSRHVLSVSSWLLCGLKKIAVALWRAA